MMDFCQVFAGIFFLILTCNTEKIKYSEYAKTIIAWR